MVLHRKVRNVFHDHAGIGTFADQDRFERQADCFAAAFLMPVPSLEIELLRIFKQRGLRTETLRSSTVPGRQRISRQAHRQSTRETDVSFARLVANRKSEELFKRRHYPEKEAEQERSRIGPVIEAFIEHVDALGRSQEYIAKLRSRLAALAEWMEKRKLLFVQDVTPNLLQKFQAYLRTERKAGASTANHYLDAMHNFFGYVVFKRRLMPGPNPASTGRQAELDRLAHRTLPPPTIYPDQVNAVVEVAAKHFDTQVVNLIVFVCEGGFRFQELQFLQVGDINLQEREIILDIKRSAPERVRPELAKRCLTKEGLWIPKTRAARRPIHITDRFARVVATMGLGDPSDWGFREASSGVSACMPVRAMAATISCGWSFSELYLTVISPLSTSKLRSLTPSIGSRAARSALTSSAQSRS